MAPFRNRLSREEKRRSVEDNNNKGDPNPFEWNHDRDQLIMTFPIHPLPSMQAPFEESMLDATGETGYAPFQNPAKPVEVRQQLLCRDSDAGELEWNFTYNCHWRNNPRGKFHPLLKTVTQIAFGVHLLHHQLEKSVADVADILLKHVNELDGFLQRANEDIEGSLRDMLFRRKCLKVPMEHVNEFDRLLDDRMYRAQLLDGNITIGRTINRMSEMLNDYLIDMSTLRDANQELDMYLNSLGDRWASDEDVARIHSAMCGNTVGWAQFLQSLVAKAEKLGVVLVQVSSYCNEIEKRCGAASRRSLVASRSSSRGSNPRDAARALRNFAENKPLPTVPNERPPFITFAGDRPTTPNEPLLQRRLSNSAAASKAAQIRPVAKSDSDDSLQERADNAELSKTNSASTIDVNPPRRNHLMQPEHDRSASRSASRHREQDQLHSRDASADTTPRPDRRPSDPHHNSDVNDTPASKRIVVRGGKGDHSPPLTGKDSAYSSVSGGSFASPIVQHPRSASAQSSHPRAQFGLFPSSAPSTPHQSLSGRYGAMSPALSPALSPPMSSEQSSFRSVQRSQTSLDNYNSSSSSSRRLLRRTSLSSLRRLFSKKKQSTVDTIAE
ncbi:hypothetical protein P154DRAFT_516921 [Amniculicola lignicola CBS 123094]|uniref:Uncharacterized protein n=1 Tax=Amniculicola lignicola CBS 123094 TaxID=1392246 RepID=A0A6A5X5I0_9PLEO|nr:hypothetical protein P154DRAFT_516921 [Amniculicola lignicola CBS 123094]